MAKRRSEIPEPSPNFRILATKEEANQANKEAKDEYVSRLHLTGNHKMISAHMIDRWYPKIKAP